MFLFNQNFGDSYLETNDEADRDEKILEQTLSIIDSVERNVVAHLYNNSFGIEWEGLERDDEYNMASHAYYEMSKVKNKDVNMRQKLIALGEYLALGSYIFTKLGGKNLDGCVRSVLYYRFSKAFKTTKEAVKILEGESEYLKSCLNFGAELGKKYQQQR